MRLNTHGRVGEPALAGPAAAGAHAGDEHRARARPRGHDGAPLHRRPAAAAGRRRRRAHGRAEDDLPRVRDIAARDGHARRAANQVRRRPARLLRRVRDLALLGEGGAPIERRVRGRGAAHLRPHALRCGRVRRAALPRVRRRRRRRGLLRALDQRGRDAAHGPTVARAAERHVRARLPKRRRPASLRGLDPRDAKRARDGGRRSNRRRALGAESRVQGQTHALQLPLAGHTRHGRERRRAARVLGPRVRGRERGLHAKRQLHEPGLVSALALLHRRHTPAD
ncbi:putative myristylated protein [Orf virus]|uniref:Putative myristylated protein n=1 Tax=Orf virus TaxID=10258 RepID=W5U372_ORFV|nr:putative myristylated protein [Orf virus]